ncbi:putative ribonuclease H-like domain-containing protein [Tanacetum coccineum]
MAKSSSSSDNEVYDNSFCSKSCKKNTENLNKKIIKFNEELSDCENDLYNYKRGLLQDEARLVEFKENEIKFYERIRVLERDIEIRDNKIENLMNELEEYSVIPPPPVQVYSPPKKDLSWMGLPKFVDDTVTDYSRPTPSIDVSKDVSDEHKAIWKSNSASFSEQRGSIGNQLEMYRNISQSPKVMSSNFGPPIIEDWDSVDESEVNFTLNKTVRPSIEQFDCKQNTWVDKGKTWKRVDHNHDNMKYPSTPTLDSAHPKLTSFVKTTHSHVKRPFVRKTAVKNKVWVPTARTKFPTVGSKIPTAKPIVAAVKGNRGKAGIPHDNINDKGYWDSGCSRHMTGNISYLSEYEPYNAGYVSFGHGGGKIIGKGIIKTGKLEFENFYFVKELKYNLFSVSQICDNKNSVMFIDSECLVLRKDFKLVDDTHVLLRTPRQQNMYYIDLKNIVPHKNLTCLIAKASEDESMLWHRRLGHLNFKTMNKLVRNNLVKGLPSKSFENNHTCVACLKGKQHKASCKTKLVFFLVLD